MDTKVGAGPGFAWEFKKGHEIVAVRNKVNGKVTVMKLLNFVSDNKCDSVFQHNKFTAGVFPPELVLKKAMRYTPSDADALAIFQKIHSAVHESSSAQLLWEVSVKEGKVWPGAVLLMSKKQLSIKVGEVFQL